MDIFKDSVAYVIVAILGVVTGVIIGLNVSDTESILNFRSGDTNLEIRKPDLTECTIDELRQIPESKAVALCSKLAKLGRDDFLSKELQKLRDQSIGPFEPEKVNVFVKFIDIDTIKGRTAGAFWGGLINVELRMVDVIEPEQWRGKVAGMEKLDVLEEIRADTPEKIDKSKTVWISKKLACEWLKITDEKKLPDWVKVEADIIRRYYRIRPTKFNRLSAFFTEHAPS